MSIVLADPSVVVNDEPQAIVPNSVEFTEGKGEQTVRAASSGGGNTEQVYADNVEMGFSMVKFSLFNDPDSIDSARVWKTNRNQNVVVVTGTTPDGKTLRRTFNQAGLLTDYTVGLGSDTSFELEFKSNPAV